jgi:hypothetical protein
MTEDPLTRKIKCLGCGNIHQVTFEKLSYIAVGYFGNPKYAYRYICPSVTDKRIEMKVTFHDNSIGNVNPGRLKVEVWTPNVQSSTQPDAIAELIDEPDKVLLEFGKDVVKNSLEAIRKFDEFMVPLTTGLITVYFALLKFLNIETYLTLPSQETLTPETIVQPTYLMLGSLLCFIISSFPLLRTLSLDSISSIDSYRKQLILWRYGWTVTAVFLFLYGLYLIIEVIKSVLNEI